MAAAMRAVIHGTTAKTTQKSSQDLALEVAELQRRVNTQA
jgi:hypothetical protein